MAEKDTLDKIIDQIKKLQSRLDAVEKEKSGAAAEEIEALRQKINDLEAKLTNKKVDFGEWD